jgi:hypothetical protein
VNNNIIRPVGPEIPDNNRIRPIGPEMKNADRLPYHVHSEEHYQNHQRTRPVGPEINHGVLPIGPVGPEKNNANTDRSPNV